jgi:hypothetical protein
LREETRATFALFNGGQKHAAEKQVVDALVAEKADTVPQDTG